MCLGPEVVSDPYLSDKTLDSITISQLREWTKTVFEAFMYIWDSIWTYSVLTYCK